jgi:hypothetical protein
MVMRYNNGRILRKKLETENIYEDMNDEPETTVKKKNRVASN